jgi:hypothetical protein
MERQNMLGKVSENNLFSTVSSYGDTEYGIRNVVLQTKKGVAWLLTELENLRGIRKRIEKGTRR